MNQEQLQQKIAEYYSKLPNNLQMFFADMNWINTLQEINTKYNLSSEQIESLSTETTLVLLGIIHMEEYVKTLEKDINIPKEQFDQLLSELNEKIFKDIGYELEETFIKNANTLAEEKYGGVKTLDERFSSLPKEVQDAISGSNYQSELYKIAEGHKLNVEQMGLLEEITTKVMLNTIHPDQYEVELKNKINLPSETVGEIVNEVNENVLKTIRELLKQNWENGKVAKNEEFEVKNEGKENTMKDEIPLPPYKTIKNEEIKNPIPEIVNLNNIQTNQVVNNNVSNPLEEKILKPVSSGQTVSDYSNTKTIPKVEDIKRSGQSDPYRETF